MAGLSIREVSMAIEDFDLLSITDVAALLRCSKAHVCKAVAGRVAGCPPIPAVSLGRRKLVRRQALLAWLEANERTLPDVKLAMSPVRGAGKRA
jgi:excisionase family DNA binding protein